MVLWSFSPAGSNQLSPIHYAPLSMHFIFFDPIRTEVGTRRMCTTRNSSSYLLVRWEQGNELSHQETEGCRLH